MMTFGGELRHHIEEYSKQSSKEYGVGIKFSQSMQFAYREIQAAIKKYFGIRQTAILEIGGGHGEIMEEMRKHGHITHSVTNNKEEFEFLKGKDMNPIFSDMHKINYKTESFDVVLISHVFEHSFAPYILMAEINEMLKKGGIVVMIVPDQDEKWIFEDYHYIVPTADQLKNLAQKLKFAVEELEVKDYCGMNHLVMIAKKEEYWKNVK